MNQSLSQRTFHILIKQLPTSTLSITPRPLLSQHQIVHPRTPPAKMATNTAVLTAILALGKSEAR